jgi:3',5'-cyclic AMP phosphodiesterase CpdA
MSLPPRPTRKTRIVCISDTHGQTPKLPKGDVLIHAGDLTNQGSYSELKKTVAWLEKAEFEVKIVVAGMFFSLLFFGGRRINEKGQVRLRRRERWKKQIVLISHG